MNLLYMLENSNTLNTIKFFIYSNKFKDITMSNQQETKIIYYFCLLRDYIRRIFLFERLRNSPTNIINIYLFLNCLKAIFKNNRINIKLKKIFFLSIIALLNRSFTSWKLNKNTCVKRSLSQNISDKIDPNWITGFVDAEGCFSVIIEKSGIEKWRVRTSFEINLHIKDVDILYKFKSFFGVGAIYLRTNKNIAVYRVSNIEYLRDNIIPHFNDYPLITQKFIDFWFWSKVVQIILKKEHLKKSGFLTILSYYASINKGATKKVLQYYPNIKPVIRISVNLPDKLNPFWVSGFVAGDGGFSINIRPSNSYILKQQVYCRFHIAQHIKEIKLMNLFIKFFNCGSVYIRANSSQMCDFVVQDVNLILYNIIPHFDIYPIFSLKFKDYICFKKGLNIIKLKQHLTSEGLYKIKALNLEMNSNRLK